MSTPHNSANKGDIAKIVLIMNPNDVFMLSVNFSLLFNDNN